MNDTLLIALIASGSALLGTVVGGLAQVFGPWVMDRRRVKLEREAEERARADAVYEVRARVLARFVDAVFAATSQITAETDAEVLIAQGELMRTFRGVSPKLGDAVIDVVREARAAEGSDTSFISVMGEVDRLVEVLEPALTPNEEAER